MIAILEKSDAAQGFGIQLWSSARVTSLGVEIPLFENMLAVRAVDAEEEVQVPAQNDVVQEHVTEEIATEVVPPTPTSPSPLSPVIPFYLLTNHPVHLNHKLQKVVTGAATQLAAPSTPIPAAKPKTLKIVAAAPAVSTRRRKGVVIRDLEEELHIDTPA
nr:hypothetical protein [Tanacetum cinerariifolium]